MDPAGRASPRGCARLAAQAWMHSDALGWFESTHRTGLSAVLSHARVWRLRLLGTRLLATGCRAQRTERTASEAAQPYHHLRRRFRPITLSPFRDAAALLRCPITFGLDIGPPSR